MKLTVRLVLALSLLLIATAPALGREYLVSEAVGFQAALVLAETNEEDDVIVLAAGRYEGHFEYRSSEARSLTIRGEEGTRRDQVILDGSDSGRALELYTDPSFGSPTFTIEVSGLTVRDGNASTESRREGGGIRANINSGSLSIVDCVIRNCTGVGDGGGLYLTSSGIIRVERCLIVDNAALDAVGAMGRGGGLFLSTGSGGEHAVVGCVVGNNYAEDQGGGLWIGFQKTGTRNIVSNTIVGNGCPEGAGIYFYAAITANVMNNVVRDNTPAQAGQIVFRDGFVTNRVGYHNDVGTVVGGWTESGGNVDVEPDFVDAAGGDFRLKSGSLLVDAGRNDAPGMINFDHGGLARILDGDFDGEPVVDIGAHERRVFRYGTIGSEMVLAGTGFGELKPKSYLLFEKKPGKWKKAKLKVLTYSDRRVESLHKSKLPSGVYPIFVQPRGKGMVPIQVGELEIKAPELVGPAVKQAAPKDLVTLTGMYFGSKKPKVLFVDQATGKKKKAKVKRIEMNPRTGLSEVDFIVPKLAAGKYVLTLANKVGESSLSYDVTN